MVESLHKLNADAAVSGVVISAHCVAKGLFSYILYCQRY